MISITTYVICWITTILIIGGIAFWFKSYKCYKIFPKNTNQWIPDDEHSPTEFAQKREEK